MISDMQRARLNWYLDHVAEPTVAELRAKPHSLRLLYLAAAVVFHSVDRAAYPNANRELRRTWRRACEAFKLVDMLAHDFKHMQSDLRHPSNPEPVTYNIVRGSAAVLGQMAFNTHNFNDTGEWHAMPQLAHAIEVAMAFVRRCPSDLALPAPPKREVPAYPGTWSKPVPSRAEFKRYLDSYVLPSIDEFKRQPGSTCHAILASIAVYHAQERSPSPDRGNWPKFLPFAAASIVANNAKHVEGEDERHQYKGSIPLHTTFLKEGIDGTNQLSPDGARHMLFLLEDLRRFLRDRANGVPMPDGCYTTNPH